MRDSRWRLVLAFALAVGLTVTACSGDGEGDEPTTAADDGDGGTSNPEPACLSGIEPPGGVDPERPAVALKIENSPAARPQSGLENADVVFEERVEGGITRFLAIFHCRDSAHAGPVRSGRFDDPKIAKPFTSLLVASGSNAIVEREMRRQKLHYFNERTVPNGALFRDPPGSVDIHTLFADTKKMRRLATEKKVKAPSQSIFEFGDLEGQGKRARVVTINFTQSNPIEYRWRGNAWKRSEGGTRFVSASGKQISVANVLVQVVRVDNSNTIVDSAGFPSPDIHLEGTRGKAVLFRDGKAIRATWKMGKVGDPPIYRTASGDKLLFARGPIWVELVPSKAGEVKGSFDFN
jgi:Protein of unknown function (DUF3048) N-terminal domain/Protein of unknown function (DUF3048) C-terminal domain